MSKWTAPQINDRSVAIINAGPVGRRIALSWILNGFDVHLYDICISSRNTTAAFLAHNTRDLVSCGQVHISTDIVATVSQAWVIIEAADRNFDIGKSLLMRAAAIAPLDAILATTSSLEFPPELTDGNYGEYAGRMVGLRYVTTTPGGVVELLKTPSTNPNITDFLSDHIEECGLTCVVEVTGSFRSITDRIRAAIETERLEILSEDVADVAQINLVCQALVGPRETSSTSSQITALGSAITTSTQSLYRSRKAERYAMFPSYSHPGQNLFANQRRKPERDPITSKRNPTASSWLLNSTESQMSPLIYVLDLGTAVANPSLHTGRVCLGSAELNEMQTLVDDQPRPDGIDISLSTGRMYWTCMGTPGEYDGLIRSCDLQGGTPVDLIPKGRINTPKQIAVDHVDSKLYFCDREGMKVWRCGLDGQDLQMIIQAGYNDNPLHRSDLTRWCVGICISPSTRKFYWTQKGPSKGNKGRIFRANMDMPLGQTVQTRDDIECLLDGLPEPIDVEIDDENQVLWWTDRGDYPNGNSLNRVELLEPDVSVNRRIIGRHFHEAIGLKIDWRNKHVYLSDIGGTVYRLDLDGRNKVKVYDFEDAAFSGICLLHV